MNTVATSIEADRTFALASYVLHLFGAVVGITSIIGLVLNYLKRGSSGEVLDSHHSWMIRSFWWTILWYVIGGITLVIGIGVAILFLAWLWYIYRHVRGLIALVNGEEMPR
jgi:uncharacterized membrane protein